MNNLYGQKTSIASIKEKYDLVIHLANVGGNGTVQRLNWAFTKGSLDVHGILMSFLLSLFLFHAHSTYLMCLRFKPILMLMISSLIP